MAQPKRKHEGSKDDDGPSKARLSSPTADGGADVDDDSNDDAMVTISGGDNDPQMPMIRVRENALSRRSFAGWDYKDRVALAGAPLTRDRHLLAATIHTLIYADHGLYDVVGIICGYCVQDAVSGDLHAPSRSVYSWPVASNLHIVVDAELQAAAIASGPRWNLKVNSRLEFGSIWERRFARVKFDQPCAAPSASELSPLGLALEMPDRSVVVLEYRSPPSHRAAFGAGSLSCYRLILEEGDRVIGFYQTNVKDFYGEPSFTWVQGETHMYAHEKTYKMQPEKFPECQPWTSDGYVAAHNWMRRDVRVDAFKFEPRRRA